MINVVRHPFSVGFLMLTRCEAAASKSVPLLICTFMFYIHPRTLPDGGLSILVFNRQLQKRERSGKEYVCFIEMNLRVFTTKRSIWRRKMAKWQLFKYHPK